MKIRDYNLHSSKYYATLYIIPQTFQKFQLHFKNACQHVLFALEKINTTQTYSLVYSEQLHLMKLKDRYITNHIKSPFQLLVTSTATSTTPTITQNNDNLGVVFVLQISFRCQGQDPSAIISVSAPIYTISGLQTITFRVYIAWIHR